MINKHINNDKYLRISLAFYNFIRKNINWTNNIDNVISSRYKNVSDYDFEYNKKLYSLFYEYDDINNLRCYIKEYNKFYDNTKEVNTLSFNYNLNSGSITTIYE